MRVAKSFMNFRCVQSSITLRVLAGVGFLRFPGRSDFGDAAGKTYPHNIFLEVAVEGGWIALLAFVVFVAVCLRALVRNSVDLKGRCFLALGVYWLLVAQTSSDLNGNRMTWIALAAGLALDRINARQSAQGTGRRQPPRVSFQL